MIKASTNYALCIRIVGRMFRVVRKGSAAAMQRARKRENRGRADRPYRVFLAGGHRVGDYIN